jgi:uncharacterized OsmC-like protein
MPNFESVYLGQLRTQNTHLASGTQILTDAPVDNHGRGEAFSPTDLVCVALGTCIITTIGIWAQNESISIEGTKLEIVKIMQASPRKITKIGIHIQVSNKHLGEEQKQRMVHIAHNCPVAKSLNTDVEQEIVFEW